MLSEPLKGIRVLDFTRLYPGPLCTLMLADLGADVIKVEAPGGELGRSMSSAFLQLNRDKRSIALNLKKEQARKIVRKLLERSDVLVESFRPGVMQRFGLDYESLRESNPRLIYCSITGYGQTGPDAQRPGHDLNYISVAGILSYCGSPEKGYVIPPVQIADTMGAFQAITATLAALFQRHQTGAGQFLDISLLDGAFFTMILLAGATVAGNNPESGLHLSGKLACYNLYRTADDRYLALALLEPKFWENFCAKLNLSHLARLQFQENQSELIKKVAEKLATAPLQHWLEYFRQEDVCLTPVQNMQEALDSEYVKLRHLFMSGTDSSGSVVRMKTPFVEKNSVRGAPRLSEHSQEILEEAGYTKEQIEEFIRNNLI